MIQKDKIKEVIMKDCAIRARYCNENGETCVIGGLLLELGVSKDDLREAVGIGIANTTNTQMANWRKLLKDAYGLTEEMLWKLQYRNDCTVGVAQRRNGVMETLDSFVENLE